MSSADSISNSPKKRIFRAIGRFFLVFLYTVLFLGIFVVLGFLWPEITRTGRSFDFFIGPVEVYMIAIILGILLLPILTYGVFVSLKLLIHTFRKQNFKVPRLAKGGIVYLFIIAILGVWNFAPFWYVDLGYGMNHGPYIAYHGENGMLISWDTTAMAKSEVKYGLSEDNLNWTATGGEIYNVSIDQSLHHAVKLSNLLPGQKYYYSIPGFDSNIYSFKTASAVNSGANVTFFMVADTQGGYPTHKVEMKYLAMDKYDYDFMCIAGDLTNRNDAYSEWAMLFAKDSYGGQATSTPWMNAPGNHENSCSKSGCGIRTNFKKYFQYDYAGQRIQESGARDHGLYYSYNNSNVHMVALDNFEYSGSDLLNTTQLNWLKADLARNQNMWKFVYFHVPMYSMGDFGSNEDLAKQLEPIFYEYQVDAVFYGHDHHFESFLVNGSASYGGTYHFIVGGGGGTLDPMISSEYETRTWPAKSINMSQITDGRFDKIYGHEYELYGEMTHAFMRVHVSGNTATFTAIRAYDGTTIVEYNVSR